MSTASVTVELDEETGELSLILTGEGAARTIAEDVCDRIAEDQGTQFKGKSTVEVN